MSQTATRLARLPLQHHGRSAEASGKAATAGGNASQGSGRVARQSGPDIAIHSNGDWDAVDCAGSVMAKLARLEREASSCNDGCESSFKRGKDPWVGCSEFGGVLLSFLSNVQRHTHPQGLRAMRGNQNVPGLGPTTILVVLHRHAGWGEISGHRTKSKQVAHSKSRRNSGQLNRVSFVFGQPDRNVVTALATEFHSPVK